MENPRSNSEPFIRAAGMADIPVLIELRLAMFQSMGDSDPDILADVAAACETYMNSHLADGSFRAWLVEVDGQIATTGGLILREAPPAYHNLAGREGYIMGIYTRPEFRHRGLAKAVMSKILTVLHEEGIPRATLRASAEGRPLYEKMGFAPTTEMRIELDDFKPEGPA